MATLIKAFFQWPLVVRLRALGNDDENVDRLNHRVTVGLILSCVVITATTSFVNNRISCWLPTELKHSSYNKYIHDYCWISNTYYINSYVDPPKTNEERQATQLGYYQWVPLLLLIMALFFYAPRLVWRSFNSHFGINIQSLIKTSQNSNENSAKSVAKMLHRYCQTLHINHLKSSTKMNTYFHRNKHQGYYIVIIYTLTRLFYLLNSILQLYLLSKLLGHRGSGLFLDFDIIKSIFRHGHPLLDSPYFPRVTLCDVPIREIGEIHRYTVQCTLPINMLNEKIFLILSFWFSYLLIYNVFHMIILLVNQTEKQRLTFIDRLTILFQENETEHLKTFTIRYLTFDGLFLLRLINHNSDQLKTIKIIKELFGIYFNNQ